MTKKCCGTCEYGIFEGREEDGVCIFNGYLPMEVECALKCEGYVPRIKSQGYMSNEDFYNGLVESIADIVRAIPEGAEISDIAKAIVDKVIMEA